jgi:hypothetical protein
VAEINGLVNSVQLLPRGSELVSAATAGATTIHLDSVEDFDDAGGDLEINGVRYGYLSSDVDLDTITLETGLTAAAAVGDGVYVAQGGQVATDYTAFVSLGEGDEAEVTIPFSERILWIEGDYDEPVPVVLSPDLETIVRVPSRTPDVSPDVFNIPGSLNVEMFLTVGSGIIAGDPLGAGARLTPAGFLAHRVESGVQKETFRVDATTGNATFLGEVGTAPPGEVGIFLFSTKFSRAGQQVTRPTMQFTTGAALAQPRIVADTGLSAGLFMHSGAAASERESNLYLNNDLAILWLQSAPNTGESVGTYFRIANDKINAVVNSGGEFGGRFEVGEDVTLKGRNRYSGTTNFAGQFITYESGTDAYAFVGLANAGRTNQQGFTVRANVSTRVNTVGQLEVVSQTSAAWRPVHALSFDVQSDRRTKQDLAAPEVSALSAVRAAPTYEYAYIDDPDGVRRLGVMADDLPEMLTVTLGSDDPDHFAGGMKGVSLPQQLALLWQAFLELDAELDNVSGLRGKKPTRAKRKL